MLLTTIVLCPEEMLKIMQFPLHVHSSFPLKIIDQICGLATKQYNVMIHLVEMWGFKFSCFCRIQFTKYKGKKASVV